MSQSNRYLLYSGLFLFVLALGVFWCVGRWQDSRAATVSAAANLDEARRLVTQIERLRRRPALAGMRQIPLTDLARLIEQATTIAGIQPGRLVRIWPQPPRRVDETPYKRISTQVLLKNLTPKQLIVFLHAVSQAETGLTVTSIRLSASHSGQNTERWDLDATISYLIYTPRRENDSRLAQIHGSL